MEPQQQRRVSSSLFQAPDAQDKGVASPVASEPENTADAVVQAVSRATRQRRVGTSRPKAGKQRTLQVTLDAGAWQAIRIEALRRGVSASRLVQRALVAHYPTVAAASASSETTQQVA